MSEGLPAARLPVDPGKSKMVKSLFKQWRRASRPAVEGGILPPGQTPARHEGLYLQAVPPGHAYSAGLEAPAPRQPGWPTPCEQWRRASRPAVEGGILPPGQIARPA